MALSSELISRFVKATKDETNVKKETVVYGVVTQTNPIYVKLSDSTPGENAAYTEPIPVDSTTTVVAVGDRVECTIKNHKLSITTSNFSAARSGDLVASKIVADDMEVANATVQGMLKAHQAVIDDLDSTYIRADELDAKYVTTEQLNADYVKTNYLTSNYITTETIDATYAKAESLDAIQGDITLLSSDVANIDSLIFGSASGNVIQTSFANSVIAQLGDAQIKSAMIDTIAADKITALNLLTGSINSNNVTIMSEDGNLTIEDGTIKIEDNNEVVRVQIGKDASNDYSINIWDQNGNLMFSEGGITDAAIKQAIIRNDMVSDTADISASKLDIGSLFKEINDSSNTIKSTKIYLDEEGQTLDVSFKTLTTEITNQGKTISSQGTAISTLQGQISSKIWQQDIDAATEGMTTYYSILEQNLNGFQTTVSTTYATKDELEATSGFATPEEVGYIFDTTDPAELPDIGEDVVNALNAADAAQTAANAAQESIDNLEIGGRNLLLQSAKRTPSINGGAILTFENNVTVEEWRASDAIRMYGTSGSSRIFVYLTGLSGGSISLNGVTYAFSMYIKNNHSTTTITISTNGLSDKTETIAPGETKRVQLVGVGNGTSNAQINFAVQNAGESLDITYWHPKIEYGNKHTDWSPAPEDVNDEITNLDTRIITAESSIKQLSDKITTNVTETTNLGTRMTTIEQTAEDISVELDTLEIGGRNLLLNTSFNGTVNTSNIIFDSNNRMLTCTSSEFEKTYSITRTLTDYGYSVLRGKTVTISGEYMVESDLVYGSTNPWLGMEMYIKRDDTTGGSTQWISWIGSNPNIDKTVTGKWNKVSKTGVVTDFDMVSKPVVSIIFRDFTGTIKFRNLKIEFGDKATDWTPAPEDVESDISNASKTATNYLNFSSDGLIIGDMTVSTLGKNVLIDSDSVDIRDGNTTLASFGADYLYLAKNSRNAKIDLCNGLATMYHESKYSYDTIFIIDTGNTTEIMGLINPLCVTSVDDLDQVSIQFANANGVLGGVGIVGDWLRRFGSNMYDTYTILDSGNYHDVMDSGWFYGGVIGEDFTLYSNDDQIQYRKIGKVVSIRGCVKPTKVITGSSDNHLIFTLPSGYRPSATVNARCQGSGSFSWLLSITTSGAVRFSRYTNGTEYVDTSTSSWLPFHVTFFID